MTCRQAGQARRDGGQALAEVLVTLLVLVPLWLGIVYVARWHDLQHATIAAARHAAFESWVSAGREDPAVLRDLTLRRMFTDDPARFTGRGAAPMVEAGDMPRWRDHRGAALVLPPGPAVSVGAAAPAPGAVQAERLAFAIIAPARALGDRRFDLQREASRGARVTVPVGHAADLPAPLGGLRFELDERLELMVDPWASRDPAQVLRRTEALSPSGRLRELARPLEPVRWALALVEPGFERLCLGRIEPDVVPADRLAGGRGPALDLRSRPC